MNKYGEMYTNVHPRLGHVSLLGIIRAGSMGIISALQKQSTPPNFDAKIVFKLK